MRYHTLASVCLLIGSTLAQQTIIVRPGKDALANAVSAASPGDTLVLRRGIYATSQITKGINIHCDPGVLLDHMYGNGFGLGSIPAGQQFSMRGGSIVGVAHAATEFSVRYCDGTVVFDGVTVPSAGDVIWSRSVAFHNCKIGYLNVFSSSVSFSDCTLGASVASSGARRKPLNLANSDVYLSATRVDGEPYLWFFGPNPTIAVDNSRLTLTGRSTITKPASSPHQAAIVGISGRLVIDPSVTISVPTGPGIGGVLTVRKRHVPWVDLVGQTAGQTMRLTMNAEPAGVGYTFLSWPIVPLHLLDDQVWVAPQSLIMLGGPVPTSGQLSVQFMIPLSAAGYSFSMQALAIAPTGELRFGAPRSLLVY